MTNTQVTSHYFVVSVLLLHVIAVNSPDNDFKLSKHVRNNKVNNNISIN